jgi:hypothetical protein
VSSAGGGSSTIGGSSSVSGSTARATGAATSAVDPLGDSTISGSDAGTARAVAGGRVSVPGQPAMPSVSAEGEVSQAVGQEGSTVLRGGGAGVIEREAGGVSGGGAEQEATAATRGGQSGASNLRYAADVAAGSPSVGVSAGINRGENLQFSQRDQVMARSRQAEDAQDQARRIVDDPTAVGTERAELAASAKIDESMPSDVGRVQSQAGAATAAVNDPTATARTHAEGAVSTQEREAEVKIGIRGSAGASREEIVGKPPTGDDEKK